MTDSPKVNIHGRTFRLAVANELGVAADFLRLGLPGIDFLHLDKGAADFFDRLSHKEVRLTGTISRIDFHDLDGVTVLRVQLEGLRVNGKAAY